MNQSTKKLMIAALMAAFTCVATIVIKIPTPTLGYIHLGDGLVLLCGVLLGPLTGGLSAGVGSMLADLFSGYASWAPATFVIKALTAGVAGLLFAPFRQRIKSVRANNICIIVCGIAGETVMVLGYFLYEAGLSVVSSAELTTTALYSGIAFAATGLFSNAIQGVTGIVIALVLLPILVKISDVREYLYSAKTPHGET